MYLTPSLLRKKVNAKAVAQTHLIYDGKGVPVWIRVRRILDSIHGVEEALVVRAVQMGEKGVCHVHA